MKAILVKYLGPTNTRGTRLKASDLDGNAVTIPYPYALPRGEGKAHAARLLCAKMQWDSTNLVEGEIKDGTVFVFDCREGK